jgi:hypothetical protein
MLIIMRSSATTIMRQHLPHQDMEVRMRSTALGWPRVAAVLLLLNYVIVGHGCHGGGHEDDEELVYRPAAFKAPQNKSPEPVRLGAR